MNHIDELYRVFLGKILNEVAQECDSFKEVTNGTLAHFDGFPYEFCLVSFFECVWVRACLLYTSPSPRDQRGSRMPSSA